ncbi:MAG: phospholipase [Pseudonocardiales bacterium]|nr:phospholipase [Pseudonocardiales bacterium]
MEIEHVVVLCLENRSFDHMLGFLEHPDPTFDGLRTGGPHENPGYDGGPSVAATPGAKKVLPFGPDHSHDAVMNQLGVAGHGAERRCSNDGFVTSYELKGRGRAPGGVAGLLAPLITWWLKHKNVPISTGRGPLVMLCQDPAQVPVLTTLALQFAVFDRWFCSVPGETWPNRNYLHAATSNGETDIEIRFYTDPTIFELLEEHHKAWHIYHDDTPQVWAFRNLWDTAERHANWYPTNRFAEHVAAGTLPHYSFIEPNHRPPLHTLDHDPRFGGSPDASDSQHPENNLVSNDAYAAFDDATDTDFTRGEQLIASIYEALRGNPELFARTLFLITYDEHGGFYDHVPPPTDIRAPDGGRKLLARVLHAIWHRKSRSFDFTMLGPRVPTVLISPLIEPGSVVHEVHDHASVPSTLRKLFAPDAPPLTQRDGWAPAFHGVASLESPRTDLPDLSAHLSTRQAVSAASAGSVSQPAPPVTSGGQIPNYYREFIAQADLVHKHLEQVREPEIAQTTEPPSTIQGALQTTAAFAEAAHRHRHPEESGS